MLCKKCGKELEEGTMYCQYCGEKQSEDFYNGENANFVYSKEQKMTFGESGESSVEYDKAKSSGTVSMVLGIISCACIFFAVFGWIASIVTGIIGLVKGIKAKKILVDPDRGKANAGFILSIVGLAISVLLFFVLLLVVGIASTSSINFGNWSDIINNLNEGSYYNY